ncbi:MAG TPA: hypothetical protein GXX58_09935 [Gelria sp.]|jgi:hypothetical protein|nr:hypothetical protein [Gelria sp.]
MLETCIDLIACEKCLKDSLGKYKYIGQVDLSRDDLDKLSQLMAVKLKADIANSIEFFREYTPACTAFFLVGQGIWNYREGDYWSSVSTSLGVNIDSPLQLQLGRIFLQFIDAQGLQTISIPGSYRYVTPILLHGGVPQNSLPLLFQRVVRVLIEKNICTPAEIEVEIEHFRELEEKKQVIQKSIQESKQMESNIQSEIRKLQHLRGLNTKAGELQRKLQQWDDWEDLPDDCEQHYIGLLEELRKIQDRKKNLIEREQVWKRLVSSWCRKEEEISDLFNKANQVKERERWLAEQEKILARLYKEVGHSREALVGQTAKLWSAGWKDEYGEILENIDWELLQYKLYQYEKIQQRYRLVVWEGFLLVSLVYYSSGKSQEAEAEYVRQQMIFRQELAAVGNEFSYNKAGGDFPGLSFQETGAQSLVDKFRTVNQKLDEVKEERERVQHDLQVMLGGLPLWADSLAIPLDSSDNLLNELFILRQLYHQYSQLCSSQVQLQARIRQEADSNAKTLQELARKLELQHSTLPPTRLVAELELKLDKTREKRYLAEESEKSLQARISTELKELEGAERFTKQEIETLEARLLKLGGGNLAQGINEVKARRAAQNDWQDIVQQINEQISFISGLTFSLDENLIAHMLEQKSQELLIQKRQTDELYRELNWLEMFTGIDEPIYRFLLYGGEWAMDWVSAASSLYLRAISLGETIFDAEETLPVRIREGFADWWQDNYSESGFSASPHSSGEEYYTTPLIILDPDSGKISLNIGIQRFHLDRLPRNITGQIYDDNEKLLQKIELKTYYCNNKSTLVETVPVNMVLLSPVPSYQVYLHLDEQVKQEWVINGIGEEDALIVFNESGKRIPLDELGRQRIWLLLDPDWQLVPNISVLEETELRWANRVYILRLIDLTDIAVGGLELVNQYGEQFFYPFQDNTPFLVGGEKYPSIYCEDLPVYRQAPETLCCPEQDMSSYAMADWELVVKRGYRHSVAYYSSKLNQLPSDSISVVNNYIQIKLSHPALLGAQPQGRYDLQLRGPGWERYSFSIVAIPNLDFGFEPGCCWPATSSSEIKLTFFVPEHATMDVYTPAQIVDREDEVYEIVIAQEENQITGELHLQYEEEYDDIPLTIAIPKIRWRLQGLDEEEYTAWQGKMQELWIGELHSSPDLCLEIELPPGLGSYAELGLDTGQMVPGTRTRNDTLKFKLLNFIDSLHDGESLHIFTLKIYDRGRKIRDEGKLFSVRCRWEVVNIEACLNNHQGQDLLKINWEEKGEACDRVLYLWRVEQPWISPYKWQIADRARHLVINLTDVGVSNGPYLLHFDTEDPWEQYTEPYFPADAINTSPIMVDNGELYLDDLQVSWPGSKRAVISGNLINNTGNCRVRVLLLGVVSDTLVYWQNSVNMVGEDRFTVKLGGMPAAVGSGKKRWLVKRTVCRETARWLVIIVEGQPCYCKFYLLPSVAPLELSLDKLVELSSRVGDQLRLKFKSSYNKYQVNFVLDAADTQKLITAWCNRNSDEPYGIKVEPGYLEVYGKSREIRLQLKNGVICIDPKCRGSGQLLPGIQEWYRDHPFCKKYKYNITQVEGELYWLWDFRRLVEEYYHKYNRDGLILLGQGQEEQVVDLSGNLHKLVHLLGEQEKALFSIIKGGQ